MKTQSKKSLIAADRTLKNQSPRGVKFISSLRGHKSWVGRMAWSPIGELIASPSGDNSIIIWDFKNKKVLHKLIGHSDSVQTLVFHPSGTTLASAGPDRTVRIWNILSGTEILVLEGHGSWVHSIAFSPNGKIIASAGNDDRILLWDVEKGIIIKSFNTSDERTWSLAFSPNGNMLVSGGYTKNTVNGGIVCFWDVAEDTIIHRQQESQGGCSSVKFHPNSKILAYSSDNVIKILDTDTFQLVRTIEGHTGTIKNLDFSFSGNILASNSTDDTICLWEPATGRLVAKIKELTSESVLLSGLSFHPSKHLLLSSGSDPNTPQDESGSPDDEIKRDHVIHVWELDDEVLFSEPQEISSHYVNAKIVLVGDTGVGKSGLSMVLNNKMFEATDSTPGRKVWNFLSEEVKASNNVIQTREALLWDLAGQPGYRIIHQLHLNEVAVALVVFDARSETDPLAGVRHWERALRLAQQRQGNINIPMVKYLVSARNDRGGVPIGEERLQNVLKEYGFTRYFRTSAKEGWEIEELKKAIVDAINWDQLPEVSSSKLFANIKSFLLDVKQQGLLLTPITQIFEQFYKSQKIKIKKAPNLKNQFDTCIGRLENRDLIRRLSFGGYILLQPELLDAYASSMVNTAKGEPDGLGSLSEEVALNGRFYVPKEQKIPDNNQEQILLHATVEELVRHDLALRENADDGCYLVFPSQFNRDYEDAPEPKGKTTSFTFDGPVQNLYSTLAVRLGHSGLFTASRTEMWRNAAIFTSKTGGKCGIFLHEFAEGRGRLNVFYPNDLASQETRFHFEEFILAHCKRKSIDKFVEITRFFICSNCGDPVPDNYVKKLKEKGKHTFECPCGTSVALAAPIEKLNYNSELRAMDKSADSHRDFDAFVLSAKGETNSSTFKEWAGGATVTLAIVFTDIVDSTKLGEEIRDEAMNSVRRLHFLQSRRLINKYNGREIKTIGDSFMTAFKDVKTALEYAIALSENTGHDLLRIRAGIHIGQINVDENDIFGGTVNFAARVIGAISGAEIWISDRSKEDIDRLGSQSTKSLNWEKHTNIKMKGFSGEFTLWSLSKR